jgi:hypothetical protein
MIKAILKDAPRGSETVEVMETVLFTEIIEQSLMQSSMFEYRAFLDFISFEHKLNARFTELAIIGDSYSINKAFDILIKSVKFN